MGCYESAAATTTLSASSSSPPATETATQAPSSIPPCPSLASIQVDNLSLGMSPANITPPGHQRPPPPECTVPGAPTLRHCGLFMDSQLRAFLGYRVGLETCSLPGAWYLLHHPELDVEVEGTSMEPGFNHTRLTRVSVTFYPTTQNGCNPVARTYVAHNSEPLPTDFTPPLNLPTANDSPGSPLGLMFGADSSVVTLTASWLNATIIIRQYSSFLSVTLQVPSEMAMASEGLCTGCPSHMYVNLTSFFDTIRWLCPTDNTLALESCFTYGGVANVQQLEDVHNNSYLDACVFGLLKANTSEALTMISMIAEDAKLLVDVNTITSPSIPSRPPIPSPSTPRSGGSLVRTEFTTGVEFSSASSFHSSMWRRRVALTIIMFNFSLVR